MNTIEHPVSRLNRPIRVKLHHPIAHGLRPRRGMAPIEQYKNDYPAGYDSSHEEELSANDIFVKYVLRNKNAASEKRNA